MGKAPAGNRSEAKRTARLCGSAVALDCGTYICVAGPMATAQGRLRVLTGNDRSAHSYCDDPAHAAKTGPSVTLFKRPLRRYEIAEPPGARGNRREGRSVTSFTRAVIMT